MEDYTHVYKEEAYELLAELEASLLELENMPDDTDLIDQIFRSLHTIKGSGAMFGFDNIAAFTHEVETVFDLVRDEKFGVSKELTDLTLMACDLIRKMTEGEEIEESEEREIVGAFQKIAVTARISPDDDSEADSGEVASGTEVSYHIRFRPFSEIFETGINPLLMLAELRELGECQVVVCWNRLPTLEAMKPEACYLYWDIFLSTAAEINAIRDVFIFAENRCDLDIRVIDDPEKPEDPGRKRIGDILLERGDVAPEVLNAVLKKQKRFGEMLLEARAVDSDTLESALLEQAHIHKAKRRREAAMAPSSIRVRAEKLDALVDLVGELVIVQARLTRKAVIGQDAELRGLAEEVERLAGDLRDHTMNIRMLPVGDTFRKFRRLIHDLSEELGKEVVVETEGEETELDKTVLEQLSDPLMHLIRNTLDHGIEPPDIRAARGKPRQGTIRLMAEHSGPDVLIRISGDGAGMDAEAIRKRAVEKGLIGPETDLSEKEVLDLIFTPGFSTARRISGVSGRGVGMDVVKRRVRQLQGTVEVESRKNRGTTVTLRLPLTLAITDGLLVEVKEECYVIPLLTVEECSELMGDAAHKARSRKMISVRGEMIPYLSLRELFETDGSPPEIEKVVVVESEGYRVGLGVDRVIGQHQTVIKSLGKVYRDVRHVAGATILGDGSVALILDVNRMVRSMIRETRDMPLPAGPEDRNAVSPGL